VIHPTGAQWSLPCRATLCRAVPRCAVLPTCSSVTPPAVVSSACAVF